MSEYQKKRREQDWGDRIPDEDQPSGYEPTYRDGSPKNECWHSGIYEKSEEKTAKNAPHDDF